MFAHLYLLSCNYFWMLCEGIYLHTLIVVAVFAEKQHLMWYYLLGWGEWNLFPTGNHVNIQQQRCHSGLIELFRISTRSCGSSFRGSPWLLQRQVRAHIVFPSLTEPFLKRLWLASFHWLFISHVTRWADVLTDVGSVLTPHCSTSSTDPFALPWWWDCDWFPLVCWSVQSNWLKAACWLTVLTDWLPPARAALLALICADRLLLCCFEQVNLFFLLNIVRVLVTKLRVTHQAESSLYMRAVRATLILIPLLGIQFVLLPYKPDDQRVFESYMYVMEVLMHYQVSRSSVSRHQSSVDLTHHLLSQGLLVSTIYCFFNGEASPAVYLSIPLFVPLSVHPSVCPSIQRTFSPWSWFWCGQVQSVLRRHWNQQRMQLTGTFASIDFFRSASYVASLTEVHRCYSTESHSEHLSGGKSYSDIFRSESPFVWTRQKPGRKQAPWLALWYMVDTARKLWVQSQSLCAPGLVKAGITWF